MAVMVSLLIFLQVKSISVENKDKQPFIAGSYLMRFAPPILPRPFPPLPRPGLTADEDPFGSTPLPARVGRGRSRGSRGRATPREAGDEYVGIFSNYVGSLVFYIRRLCYNARR